MVSSVSVPTGAKLSCRESESPGSALETSRGPSRALTLMLAVWYGRGIFAHSMSNLLREQLQTSLGASYSLERELGGGGMSCVFVARDLRLERSVVVKALSPELAAG